MLVSWLGPRIAEVLVEGKKSEFMQLMDEVFQGTVWGPMLWNAFYGDSSKAIRKHGFTEVVYADDLNAFKAFENTVEDSKIWSDMNDCQQELHRWGDGNQVSFDPGKESKHILGTGLRGDGGSFILLGVTFDVGLIMADEIQNLCSSVSWKAASILRARRYFNTPELVNLWKSKVLSYIECRTPGIYHAADTHLKRLDSCQRHFLSDIGLSEAQSLHDFNLAPLNVRRDISMLGLIHRTLLGKGPEHFREFFRVAETTGNVQTRRRAALHTRPRSNSFLEIGRRSALGLVAIYNLLPQEIVDCDSVSSFQAALQALVKVRAQASSPDWRETLSPRVPLLTHPLHYVQRESQRTS